jgi:hypothetical protein
MVTISEWYERVNQAVLAAPPPTEKEAINAVRRLYRFITKNKWRGKFARAKKRNGYTWPRGTTFFVNPDRRNIYNSNRGGWHDLLHDLSHYLHWYRWGNRKRPHCREHARLELKLRRECVRRGWISASQPAVELPQAPPAERREEQAVGQPS